jgi:hypothetical protein
VVTQRTANPCTPVRFRLGPPDFPTLLHFVRRERARFLVVHGNEFPLANSFRLNFSIQDRQYPEWRIAEGMGVHD